MSRNSLLEAGAKSEVYYSLKSYIYRLINLHLKPAQSSFIVVQQVPMDLYKLSKLKTVTYNQNSSVIKKSPTSKPNGSKKMQEMKKIAHNHDSLFVL